MTYLPSLFGYYYEYLSHNMAQNEDLVSPLRPHSYTPVDISVLSKTLCLSIDPANIFGEMFTSFFFFNLPHQLISKFNGL